MVEMSPSVAARAAETFSEHIALAHAYTPAARASSSSCCSSSSARAASSTSARRHALSNNALRARLLRRPDALAAAGDGGSTLMRSVERAVGWRGRRHPDEDLPRHERRVRAVPAVALDEQFGAGKVEAMSPRSVPSATRSARQGGLIGESTAAKLPPAGRAEGPVLRDLGEIAQLVEHTTENRGVLGSIPSLAIRTLQPRVLNSAAALSFRG